MDRQTDADRQVLSWPKSSFGFFGKMLWKTGMSFLANTTSRNVT